MQVMPGVGGGVWGQIAKQRETGELTKEMFLVESAGSAFGPVSCFPVVLAADLSLTLALLHFVKGSPLSGKQLKFQNTRTQNNHQ